MQAWQEEVSQITLQVDVKIIEFKAMQTIIASLLKAPVSAELVDMARECIDQIDKDLIGLKAGFAKFTTKIKKILKSHKTSASGSGTSHKWVLGACWSIGPQLWKVS